MNIDQLQAWIETTAWPFVESASVASLLVLLVVAILWRLVRRRASAHLGYALFLMPLVPFVVPTSGLAPLEVPFEVPRLLRAWSIRETPPSPPAPREARQPGTSSVFRAADDAPTQSAHESMKPGAFDSPSTRVPTTVSPPTATRAWPLAAFAVWASVATWLAWRWTRGRYRTLQLVRAASAVADPRTRWIVQRAMRSARLRRPPRLAESSRLHAPAVFGFRRPTLLLPTGLATRLDDEALTWSVQHELAHLRRADLWVAALQRALSILWWFHPLVWISNHWVDDLRECACDEAALARVPGLTGQRAAAALMDVVEASRGRCAEPLALESMHSHKHSLEKRIMRLIDRRRVSRPGLTPTALLVVCFTGGLGMASTQLTLQESVDRIQESVPSPRVESSTEPEEPQELEEVRVLDEPGDTASLRAEAAVARALTFLLSEQLPDGHWETGHPHAGRHGSGHPIAGMAGEFNDVGVTALAIECLSASPRPEHLEAARRGLAWLASVQDPELGLFGVREGFGYLSGHALATRLWIRSHRGRLQGANLEVARRAVDIIQRARNPYSAWRFDYPPIGDNDVFVTSLMLQALAEARGAGLDVEPAAFEDGLRYLGELTDTESWRTGYVTRGGPSGRLAGKAEDFPREFSEYPTAMAILARLDSGVDPIDSDAVLFGSALIARLTPQWDPVKGRNDAYYWLFGTRALRRIGGVGWQRWRRDLLNALLPNQRADGDWPLMDAWSGTGDRVHITSVYTLALQEALIE